MLLKKLFLSLSHEVPIIVQEVILSSQSTLDNQKGQKHTYYTCRKNDCRSVMDPSGGTINKTPKISRSCAHKFQHSEDHDVYAPSTAVW